MAPSASAPEDRRVPARDRLGAPRRDVFAAAADVLARASAGSRARRGRPAAVTFSCRSLTASAPSGGHGRPGEDAARRRRRRARRAPAPRCSRPHDAASTHGAARFLERAASVERAYPSMAMWSNAGIASAATSASARTRPAASTSGTGLGARRRERRARRRATALLRRRGASTPSCRLATRPSVPAGASPRARATACARMGPEDAIGPPGPPPLGFSRAARPRRHGARCVPPRPPATARRAVPLRPTTGGETLRRNHRASSRAVPPPPRRWCRGERFRCRPS